MRDFANKPKLLAPAGNANALKAAVYNGADAVYLGIDKFNARLKADNFTLDTLAQWIDFCHLFGVEVNITLNTSLKKGELSEAKKVVEQLLSLKADSIIITDISLLSYCAKLDKINVVASTQLNVHNELGAKAVKRLGADVVVLSRETPYEDICNINNNVDIDTEVFLHGALCVSVSGQCYLSSFVDGNSGNKGLCAQPCRQLYTSFDKDGQIKSGYLLSAKDLCGVHTIERLANAGVSILKIEGRNRREQYVGEVCSIYRKIIDNNYTHSADDIKQLKIAFNRGDYTSGYLNNADNIIYTKFPGHKGIEVGQIKIHESNFVIESPVFLHEGDNFKIFRQNEEVGNCVATGNSSKKITQIKYMGVIKEGDRVCQTSSAAMNFRISHNEKKIKVHAEFNAKAGEYPILNLSSNGIRVQVIGQNQAELAKNYPLTTAQIEELLSRTGNTEFIISDIVIYSENIFIPKSSLNELRREGIEKLRKALLENYYANKNANLKNFDSTHKCDSLNSLSNDGRLICQVKNGEDYLKIRPFADIIIFKPEVYSVDEVNRFSSACKDFFLDLPNFANQNDLSVLNGIIKQCSIAGIVANNLYALELAKENNLEVILGLGLNIYNREAACILGEGLKIRAYLASQELTLKEIKDDMSDAHIFAGGQITVMTVAHCPIKVNLGSDCKKCRFKPLYYKDKTGRNFYIQRKQVSRCYFEIENCVPLDATKKINFPGKFYLKFDGDVEEVKHFYILSRGKDDDYRKTGKFTSGHLSNSVK